MNTDVVIVGAGASGIAAALTLVQQGKKVVLLEKGDKFGGAGMFGAQGLFAVESSLQKETGEKYTIEDAYQELVTYTHYRSNLKITKAILEKSASTITWLKENGLETELVNNTQEVHQNHPKVYHQYIDKFAGFQRLMKRFLDLGGILKTKTAGQELITENGRISGIKILTDDKIETISCKAVIMADGGYVGNADLVATYWPFNIDNLYSMGERKSVGDGIKMLAKLGADTRKMGVFENHAASVTSKINPKWKNQTIFSLTNLPFLWIDSAGKRFVNEDVCYDFALWGNATYTVGGYYYYLLDQKTIDFLKSHELDWTDSFERTFKTLAHQPMDHKIGPFSTIESDLQDAVANQTAWRAETIEALADNLKMPAHNLKETILQYNQAISQTADFEFNKASKFMKFDLTTSPFYAIKAVQTTLGTIGGVEVNEKFEALKPDRTPLKGAFVVGNNASGMYDTSYPTLEGISCAFAWNSGRIAGQSAAKLIDLGDQIYYN